MCKIFSQNVTSQPFIEKTKTAKNKQRKIDTDGIGFIHFTFKTFMQLLINIRKI